MTRSPPRRRCAALAAGLALAACATGPGTPAAPPVPAVAAATDAGEVPKVVREHPLIPYAIHEECLRLAAGDRVDYDFSATLPVAFNIHYHEANAVVAPVVREGVRGDSGVFAPRLAQDYCLMWEAGPGGAVLDYRLRRRAAAP